MAEIKIARVGGVLPSGCLDVQLHGSSTIPEPDSQWVPVSDLDALRQHIEEVVAELEERGNELWSDEHKPLQRARAQGVREAADRLTPLLVKEDSDG